MEKELKREIILDNYQNPYHKETPNGDYIKVNTNNESCIDNLDIYFDVEDNYIKDVYFNGEACAISTSATSIMLKNLVNKSVDEARLLIENYKKMINEEEYNRDLLKDLVVYDDIYLQPNRKTCALLPAKAVDKLLDSLK